jgi:YidC/Oxa1 family membrane protein insertase
LKFKPLLILVTLAFVIPLASLAFAKTSFGTREFKASDFKDADKIAAACQAGGSFFCGHQNETLTVVTTNGFDVMFDSSGEIMALYSKGSRSKKNYKGSYNVADGSNLIPYTAAIPAGAILLDGKYVQPKDVQSDWKALNPNTEQGTFNYQLRDLSVHKTVRVSRLSETLDVSFDVSRGAQLVKGAKPVTVQYALEGIAHKEQPIIKIGQKNSSSKDPVSQPVANPTYISLQTKDSSGEALILRSDPNVRTPGQLSALATPPHQVGLLKTLPAKPGAKVSFALNVYGGPNELAHFYQEGYLGLNGLFHPNVLGWISIGILTVLSAVHSVVHGWGLSIIVLTLLFRLLIWPLVATQARSMMKMQKLQPKMKELQKKHKGNREKLQQETMKLYKEEGANPAGGCLPMLVQMPILLILWRVFINFQFNQGFLWIPDLSLPDPYFLLPALYVGVMIGQSYFLSQGNKNSLRQQMLMNVIFVFIIINFPAAVTLYYVTSMLVQVLQYYLVRRTTPAAARPASSKG